MKKITLFITLLFALSIGFTACDKDDNEPEIPGNNGGNNNNGNGNGSDNENGNNNGNNENTQISKLKITIGDKVLTATLANNATARDFLTLLPLTMELSDYNNTEKINYLSRRLSTTGAPSSINPEIGDVTYYAPWGNIAIFYRDFGVSNGLVLIGKIDSGIETLQVSGSLQARIEVLETNNENK